MKRKIIIYVSLTTVNVLLFSSAIILLILSHNISVSSKTSAVDDTTLSESVLVEPTATQAPVTDAALPLEQPQPSETLEEAPLYSSSEPEANRQVTATDRLEELLARNGASPQQLSNIGCSQLVTVESYGATAQINFYSLDDEQWLCDDSMTCQGYVGLNGVTTDMHENSYATPVGLYSIGEAFYIYQQPTTNLASFEITSDTYWVDDPDSAYYNKRVEGTANKDWNSAEHMIEYSSSYEYGFVINYNLDAVYNAGSAIFFHVSSNPTAGCVATDRNSVLRYLGALDATKLPYILIV